jgi:Tfp pilus assembly protein PilV
MLEVLVAMMVVFLTFMTSLNGLLYATLFQVKAEKQAQAVYWIQQDLERVKSLAASASTAAIYTAPPSGITACSGTGSENTCFKDVTSGASGSYNKGFARRLEGNLDGSSTGTDVVAKTDKLLGKFYNLIRNASGDDANPQVLKITYTVREQDDPNKILATLYTEVLPSAALSP